MTYVSSSFSLKESDIGPFDPTVLDSLMTLFMSQGVVPTMNTYLAQGVQLPVVPGMFFFILFYFLFFIFYFYYLLFIICFLFICFLFFIIFISLYFYFYFIFFAYF